MQYLKNLYNKYGVLIFITVAAVVFKILLFYNFMGVTANLILMSCITLFIIYLIFDIFDRKWIPAVIYLMLSILMFSDVAYCSFFNRYLSVSMLSAANLLVGVWDCVKEIVKPKFFVMFLDNVLIFVTLWYARHKSKKANALSETSVGEIKVNEDAEENAESSEIAEKSDVTLVASDASAGESSEQSDEKTDEKDGDSEENDKDDSSDGPEDSGENEDGDKHDGPSDSTPPESDKTDENNQFLGKKVKFKKKKDNAKKTVNVRKTVDLVMIVGIIAAVIVNLTGSYTLMSLSNREFFSYYAKDLLENLAGLELSDEQGKSETMVYTGTYENQIDGPLYGIAKGRNLIVVQMESFQNFVINAEYDGQELTPELNKLIAEDSTIYFDNYYQQVSAGNTSDAEYATNNGLYGSLISYTYLNYTDRVYRGLPVQLKEKFGYSTAVFHAYEPDFWNRENFYPAEGFDTFYSKDDFSSDEIIGMGLSDEKWFGESVEYMKTMQQPFYSFMVTLSNHHPFQVGKSRTKIQVNKEDKGTLFGSYVQSVNYADYAVGCFIQDLKDAGLYDNSIICFYGDHHGLTVEDDENVEEMSKFLGKDYSYEDMMNVPLIIHIPGQSVNQTVSVVGGETDFLPTISYLMGLETLDTLYIGQNLLTADEGFVCEYYYMNKGSYFDDDTVFVMSGDGVFENSRAYDRNTGEPVMIEQCMQGYLKSLNELNSCEYYLRNDVINKLYNENYSSEDVITSLNATMSPPVIIANAGAPSTALKNTNSLEALEESYSVGYRTMKVNLEWTSDGRTVLLTDWGDTKKLFTEKLGKSTTYEEFMDADMNNGLTQMDFSMLGEWMRTHPDVYIAIDISEDMGYLLQAIEKYYTDISNRIIPVFSKISDYNRGDTMGFANCIFQIEEKSKYSVKEIEEFVNTNDLWAVAFPKSDVSKKYKNAVKSAAFAYAYDVNNLEEVNELAAEGIQGYYTDRLMDSGVNLSEGETNDSLALELVPVEEIRTFNDVMHDTYKFGTDWRVDVENYIADAEAAEKAAAEASTKKSAAAKKTSDKKAAENALLGEKAAEEKAAAEKVAAEQAAAKKAAEEKAAADKAAAEKAAADKAAADKAAAAKAAADQDAAKKTAEETAQTEKQAEEKTADTGNESAVDGKTDEAKDSSSQAESEKTQTESTDTNDTTETNQ